MGNYTMTSYLLYMLLGQFMPSITDLVNKHVQDGRIRFVVSILLSALVAVLFNMDRLVFGSYEEALVSALVLWFSGQTAYKMYYEGSKWQANIRFTDDPLPLKGLIPPVADILPQVPTKK